MVDPAIVNTKEDVENPAASFRACADAGVAWEVIERSDAIEREQFMSDSRESYICEGEYSFSSTKVQRY